VRREEVTRVDTVLDDLAGRLIRPYVGRSVRTVLMRVWKRRGAGTFQERALDKNMNRSRREAIGG